MSILILRTDLEGVLEEVARLGVLHPARMEEVDEWTNDLASAGADSLAVEYSRRQRRLHQLLEGIPAGQLRAVEERAGEVGLRELGEIDETVARVEGRLDPLIAKQSSLQSKRNELRSLLTQLGMLMPSGVQVRRLMQSTFLASAIGLVQEVHLPKLRAYLADIPSVVFPYQKEGDQFRVICVVLRRDKAILEHALRAVGFGEVAMPGDLSKVSAEVESQMAHDMAAIETDLSQATKQLEQVQTEVLPELIAVTKSVEAALLVLRIRNYAKVTEKTSLFSGWIPAEQTEAFVGALRDKTKGRAVVEVVDAAALENVQEGRVEVPVKPKLPALVKPFRVLVESYGVPSYRTIDPTIFVGITFLLMFGMMFGDVGHGLLLVLGGILLLVRSSRFRDIGRLGVYCGASSMCFGALYGSVFGLETVIPALWVKPLDGVATLFKVTIAFGVIVLSLGFVLNMINSFRTHSFLRNFFDETGPLIAIAYWAAIGLAVKVFMFPTPGAHLAPLVTLIATPLVLFVARGPILYLLGRQEKAFPEGVFLYFVEGTVELVEILMGFLSNTVSFIRVAAFGLAHAGLFVAVFSLAEAVRSSPGGQFTSMAVILVGNAIIVLLEGLVVTIQALRLEYYEFFGKFFKGAGSKYEPVGFRSILLDKAN